MHLRILSGAVVVIFLCLGMLLIVPDNSSAAAFPKVISGLVYEGDSTHPVFGAYVLVEIYDVSHNLLGSSYDPHTDSTGFYTVTISVDVALATTIEVTATYGVSNQKTVTVADNDILFAQTIDVPFPYAIPQLAGIGGMLAAVGIIGAVAIVSMRTRRR